MPHLERSVQPSSKTLIHSGRPQRSELHVVPQHEFLGIRMEIDLLMHPLRHRIAVVANPSCTRVRNAFACRTQNTVATNAACRLSGSYSETFSTVPTIPTPRVGSQSLVSTKKVTSSCGGAPPVKALRSASTCARSSPAFRGAAAIAAARPWIP
jgi:hypothetical protein